MLRNVEFLRDEADEQTDLVEPRLDTHSTFDYNQKNLDKMYSGPHPGPHCEKGARRSQEGKKLFGLDICSKCNP